MSRFVFATAEYASGDWESAPLVPENLIDSVARYTTLDVTPAGVNVKLSSDDLFDYPFVWMTGHLPVRLTDVERRNVKRYVERGGFLMVDDHNHDVNGAFHKTAVEEIERTFGRMTRLPDDHELYSTFFVFDDGPPNTQHELNGYGDDMLHRYLDAVLVNDRIGLLYSNKDYSSEWNFHADSKRFATQDITKFGVNLIVYALTR
ncbi:MAG: DUF4159 domain-containing protein [Gemmatimonadaceae bacterium]